MILEAGFPKLLSLKNCQRPSNMTNEETLSLNQWSSPALRLLSDWNKCLCAPWKLTCSKRITCAITKILCLPTLPKCSFRLPWLNIYCDKVNNPNYCWVFINRRVFYTYLLPFFSRNRIFSTWLFTKKCLNFKNSGKWLMLIIFHNAILFKYFLYPISLYLMDSVPIPIAIGRYSLSFAPT